MSKASTAATDALPADAMRFLAPASFDAPSDAGTSAGGDRKRKVRGVAYAGGIITGHPFWDRVAFDLSSTEVDARIPLLVDHDSSQRAGYASLVIEDRAVVIGDDTALLDNAVGRQVAADADAGFPWQLSVHIQPQRIQRIEAGESVTINGQEMTGPLTVFRQNRIREVSFTPTGADHRTHARVFNATRESPPEANMSETLQAQLDQANAQLAAAKSELESLKAALNERDTALRKMTEDARFSAVCALFHEVGRERPERAAVAAYLSMSEEQFAAVAKDLRASKPNLPPSLFSHQANGPGDNRNGTVPENVTAEQFAAMIREKIASERAAGRVINAAQAAVMIRGRVPCPGVA